MKKLYSILAMALAVAMPMWAQTGDGATDENPSQVSMYGTYNHSCFDLVVWGETTEQVAIVKEGDQSFLSGLGGWSVPVTVDAEAGTVTLPTQVALGYDDATGFPVYFSLASVVGGYTRVDIPRENPSVGTFDGEKIEFDPDDICGVYAVTESGKISYIIVSMSNKLSDFVAVSPDDTSAIDQPAVNGVPVEYYDLRGVCVGTPAPGQIIIKRQGNTVSKELVR